MISLARNWRQLLTPSLAVVLAACGSVGEPLPPLLHIPGRVEDFAVRQEASELVAEWTWPVLSSEGQVFHDMERFEVYSVDVPASGELPGADALSAHGEFVTSVAPPDPVAGPGTRLAIRVPLVAQGAAKRGFAVRGVSGRGRIASWSELRFLDIVQPPDAPSDLVVTTIEEGVKLVWTPVQDVAGYDIERRIADGEFVSIGTADGPEFLDPSPQWDLQHSYRVKALKTAGSSPEVPSSPSAFAALTPSDVFPPATPTDLRALAVEGGVELSWSSNSEPDLAGYRVLRDGSPVHEGLLEAANLSDQPLAAGQTVVYQVTAVDRSGNVGAPAEVEAVGPR